ncbi:hypothetical protein [Kineococcus radiotolerans]|nr:hypothetical protein [Kineococcus radiotolerans]
MRDESGKWIQWVATGLGVIVIVLGWVIKDKSDDASRLQTQLTERNQTVQQRDDTIAGQRTTIDDLKNQVGDLTTRVSSLTAANETLQAQVDAVVGTAPESISMDPAIRHTGQAVLRPDNSGLDLDVKESIYGWNPLLQEAQDIAYTNVDGDLRIASPAKIAYLGNTVADYKSCSSTRTYTFNYVKAADLATGAWMCVYTSDGRYSVLRVYGRDNTGLGLEITTYEKA